MDSTTVKSRDWAPGGLYRATAHSISSPNTRQVATVAMAVRLSSSMRAGMDKDYKYEYGYEHEGG
jgi:hypothetical protein